MTYVNNAALLLIAAASTALSVSSVSARQDSVVGVGDFPCATYIRLYDDRDNNGRKLLLQRVEEWALGYMSGLNKRAGDGAARDLSFYENADLGFSILSQCRNRTGVNISAIVRDIYANAPPALPGSA